MSAHALPSKFGPQRATGSMVLSEQPVLRGERPLLRSEHSAELILKQRFRTAFGVWRSEADGTRDQFADTIGATAIQVKGWLSNNPMRPVPPEVVLVAEGLAQESRLDGLSDREIADAVREKARADARMARIRERLLEAA